MGDRKAGVSGGLLDQAVVSFGNFALSLLLARILPVSAYGDFVAILSFVFFFNLVHQAAVAYPLSVKAAAASGAQYRTLLARALLATPLCAVLFLVPLALALYGLGQLRLLPLVFLAMLAWQLQETLRRGLLARARFFQAMVQDGLRYIGLPVAILLWHAPIAVANVFLLVLASSLLVAVPQIYRLRPTDFRLPSPLLSELTADWRLALPVIGATLLSAFSTQWYLWILAWHHDKIGAAALAALANVAALISPIMLGIENVLVPEVARMSGSRPFGDTLRLLRTRSVLCCALIIPLYGAVFVFPEASLRLFYGHATVYAAYPQELRVLLVAYGAYLANSILGATLRGYRAGRAVLLMQAYPAAVGLILGSWLTLAWGLAGACIAALLTGLLRAGLGLRYVTALRTLHEAPAVTTA